MFEVVMFLTMNQDLCSVLDIARAIQMLDKDGVLNDREQRDVRN
jgi:hypothetical protein